MASSNGWGGKKHLPLFARVSGNEAITVKTLNFCSAAAEERLKMTGYTRMGKKISVAHQ